LSWRFVERPFRQIAPERRNAVLFAGGSSAAAIIAVGLFPGTVSHGAIRALPAHISQASRLGILLATPDLFIAGLFRFPPFRCRTVFHGVRPVCQTTPPLGVEALRAGQCLSRSPMDLTAQEKNAMASPWASPWEQLNIALAIKLTDK